MPIIALVPRLPFSPWYLLIDVHCRLQFLSQPHPCVTLDNIADLHKPQYTCSPQSIEQSQIPMAISLATTQYHVPAQVIRLLLLSSCSNVAFKKKKRAPNKKLTNNKEIYNLKPGKVSRNNSHFVTINCTFFPQPLNYTGGELTHSIQFALRSSHTINQRYTKKEV